MFRSDLSWRAEHRITSHLLLDIECQAHASGQAGQFESEEICTKGLARRYRDELNMDRVFQETTTTASEAQTPKMSAESLLIYVVDDEPMIGDVVEVILGLGGFSTRFFVDPQDALIALQEEEVKPDLLLTDYTMKPINGLELIAEAKLILPGLRTVLYSGNVGGDVVEEAEFKPDGFLAKPFLPKNLVRAVNRVLGRLPEGQA